MGFDVIHGCQATFRALLEATSYPGRCLDLSLAVASLATESPLPPSAFLIAICLIDVETTFYVEGDRKAERETFLSRLCGAEPARLGDADFVFVPGAKSRLAELVLGARAGDLVDPHKGATIVAAVEALSSPGRLRLRGPGIDGERDVAIARDPEWISARTKKNEEFPLGVDFFFFDAAERVMALPRTTLVSEVP